MHILGPLLQRSESMDQAWARNRNSNITHVHTLKLFLVWVVCRPHLEEGNCYCKDCGSSNLSLWYQNLRKWWVETVLSLGPESVRWKQATPTQENCRDSPKCKGYYNIDFKTSWKDVIINTARNWHTDSLIDQWETMVSQEMDLYTCVRTCLTFSKGQMYSLVNAESFLKRCLDNYISLYKKVHFYLPYSKSNSKCIVNLNVKPKC